MIKKSIALFVVAVFCIVVPSQTTRQQTAAQATVQQTAAQATEQELAALQSAFENELLMYAATHTDSEVAAYAQERLTQMTLEAMDAIPVESSFADDGDGGILIEFDPGPGPGTSGTGTGQCRYDSLRFCISSRNRECQLMYTADVNASIATSTAILAGCIAFTGGTQFALCAAAALAAHAANILAAQNRYEACLWRGQTDCYLQYCPPR